MGVQSDVTAYTQFSCNTSALSVGLLIQWTYGCGGTPLPTNTPTRTFTPGPPTNTPTVTRTFTPAPPARPHPHYHARRPDVHAHAH